MKTTIVIAASEYKRSRVAWLAARKAGLGASDTAAVLCVDPWRTPLDVYLDKVNPLVRDESIGEAAEWGTHLEAVVARRVAARHRDLGKLTPTPGLCAHPEHPWMMATPDRLLVDRVTGAQALLEIKTTDGRNKDQWEAGPPPRVEIQVQQQLAVTGLETAYVACLFGGREMPEPWLVKRDEAVIALIIEHAGRFWRDNVLALVPPEPRMGDEGNLVAMYPGNLDVDALVADNALESLFKRRADLAHRAHLAEADLAEVDLQIKNRMGDATTIINGDGKTLATWKPGTSTRLDTKRLKAEQPDLADLYTTTINTRRFLTKDPN